MGFLFASSKKNKIPEITGLQIQTAVNVVAIPICYGSPRVPMNIIYANGFRSVKEKSGGKGLFSSGKGNVTGYKYYATYIGALGEGEFNTLLQWYEDNNIFVPGSIIPSDKQFEFFSGSDTQDPWTYIVDNWPDDAFSYRRTAYVGFPDYQIEQSGTIPQLNFLVKSKFHTFPLNPFQLNDGTDVIVDADPAACVYDFLTNEIYGVKFPASFIDTTTVWTSADGFDPDVGDAALSTFCQAVGMGWSVCVNNPEPASSILDRWFKNLVVAAVWTGEKLKFVPYCDTASGANPGYSDSLATVDRKYYTPDVGALFDLTIADFIQSEHEDDPVLVTRADPFNVKNTVRVDYRDRDNKFNDNVSEAKDELFVELYGPRVDRIGTADEFTYKDYASVSAWLQLARNISVTSTIEFRLAPQWCLLEPMDIITITYEKLALDHLKVRVKEVNEDGDGYLSFICENMNVGAVQGTEFVTQNNDPTDVFVSNEPAPAVNEPAIFEPTDEYLAAASQASPIVVIGASGGPAGVFSSLWGGCQVWLSDDNITYSQYATIVGAARQGVLTDTFPAYSGSSPDVTNTLSVSLAESDGELETVTDFQAISGLSLCAIIESDGTYEFVGYVDANLTGPNAYDLTRVYRGMFGTQACSHASGAKFVRYDSLCKEIVLPPAFIGITIYIKLPSFNIYSLGLQDIADATAYTYTPQGWGSSASTNPLATALLSGVTPIDLDSFYITTTLDLGSISAGDCAPVGFDVDLENY